MKKEKRNIREVAIVLKYRCTTNDQLKRILKSYDSCVDCWNSAILTKIFSNNDVEIKNYEK
jgi:hypothetical protein